MKMSNLTPNSESLVLFSFLSVASTQFESTSARAAFPCFDEPALKATFTLTLVRHKNFTTLFNTPLVTSQPMENDK